MVSVIEEFGIEVGGLLSFDAFKGESKDYHGFFLHDYDNKTLLCYKEHFHHAPPEMADSVTWYDGENDTVEEYWDGMRDGDWKGDIRMIVRMKTVPYAYYTYIRESKYWLKQAYNNCFAEFAEDMKLLF